MSAAHPSIQAIYQLRERAVQLGIDDIATKVDTRLYQNARNTLLKALFE
ncbi:MAG: hypothetical protein VBE63_18155 [Lamprobacter sp.]|nr:hypothetical protein [Lamprobacter sp.]MEA3641838.1 hypothetical protein [Lamprobacter sp.]